MRGFQSKLSSRRAPLMDAALCDDVTVITMGKLSAECFRAVSLEAAKVDQTPWDSEATMKRLASSLEARLAPGTPLA
jgi:hypothetical protein